VPEETVERNDSLLTGRNLWQNQTQEGWPSASTYDLPTTPGHAPDEAADVLLRDLLPHLV